MKKFVASLAIILAPLMLRGMNLEFEVFKASLLEKAVHQGVNKQFAKKQLDSMELLPDVVKSDKNQAEFVKDFWDYADRSLNPARIAIGKRYLSFYSKDLNYVYQTYGIPPHYLLAFWGLETNYGTFTGKIKTLDALGTLAYDQRRRTFFTKELLTFLNLAFYNKLENMHGSWAGAFGHFQFMPSTLAHYGVDCDHDGKIDILNSKPDALCSAGNYLHALGWDPKAKWGRIVKLTKPLDLDFLEKNPKQPLSYWAKNGVKPLKGQFTNMDIQAKLIYPMGLNGPLFLVYDNFYKIMKWNRSELYALSIALLADRIKGEEVDFSFLRSPNKLKHQEIIEAQEKLKDLGLYDGEQDGHLGSKTKKAIRSFQRKNHLVPDGYLSPQVLSLLLN